MEEKAYFGLRTGQGLVEFECKNKAHKQKWVESARAMLEQVTTIDVADKSLKLLELS